MKEFILIETIIGNVPSLVQRMTCVLGFQGSHWILKHFGVDICPQLEVGGCVRLHQVVILVVIDLSAMDRFVVRVSLWTNGGGQCPIVRKDGAVKGGHVQVHTMSSTHDIDQTRIQRRKGPILGWEEITCKLQLILVQRFVATVVQGCLVVGVVHLLWYFSSRKKNKNFK